MSDFDDNPFSFNYSGTDISKKIKIIFHIDFDYFFAQCEEIREQSIKNSPVVVCVYSGCHQDSGVVSTSNYHARKYGVKSSMPIKFAKNKLGLVKSFFFPLDIAYYKSISWKIMSIISSFSDIIEIRGLDECYLDVTSLLYNFDKSLVLAEKIKKPLRTIQVYLVLLVSLLIKFLQKLPPIIISLMDFFQSIIKTTKNWLIHLLSTRCPELVLKQKIN